MTTVDAEEYRASHRTTPTGHGLWIFKNLDTGDTVELTADYDVAVVGLPEGHWKLMP